MFLSKQTLLLFYFKTIEKVVEMYQKPVVYLYFFYISVRLTNLQIKDPKVKKYIYTSVYAVSSWLILLFIYNYRSNARDFGILIPTFMTCVALLTSNLINKKIVPGFYLQRKYKQFVFFLVAIFILSIYVQILFLYCIFIIIQFDLESVIPRMKDVLVILTNTWLIILAGISIEQTRQANLRQRTEEVLKREKTEVELKMLKAQINPHFLFNTLNSIYVLSKKKSDKTPEVVLMLSQMLDYLLYQTDNSQIEIIKEIEFINNYIDLEKVRYDDKLDVKVEVNLKNLNYKIEPMLFIPLVENAFKHGVKHERKKAEIEIKVSDNQWIVFSISNSVPSVSRKEEKGGIGLKNLKDRLDKLYGQKYNLDILKTEGNFRVALTIMDEL